MKIKGIYGVFCICIRLWTLPFEYIQYNIK